MSTVHAAGGYVAKREVDFGPPRSLRRYLSLDDFELQAKKRLPRQIYGYYAGGAETCQSLDDNRRAFRDLSFRPSVLAQVSGRSTTTSLFGESYAAPFGIAPMGLSGLSTFEGDLALAKAAAAEAVPMVVSATGIMPLERVRREGGATWFQAYLPGEPDRILKMLERVERAGFATFVVTADVPVAANRENNVRTGFSMPLKPSFKLAWDGMTHPGWSLGTFLRCCARGVPHFENMDHVRGAPILSRDLVRAIGRRDDLAWEHVELIRRHWRGTLVVKGILSAADAGRARACGVDGVWVSNHGGRQLDGAVSGLRVLREIKAAAGDMALMLDGGVRRGSDVLKALALGADFVFAGRPFLFAAAAAGLPGVGHAIRLLKDEIDRDMALLGVTRVADVSRDHLIRSDQTGTEEVQPL